MVPRGGPAAVQCPLNVFVCTCIVWVYTHTTGFPREQSLLYSREECYFIGCRDSFLIKLYAAQYTMEMANLCRRILFSSLCYGYASNFMGMRRDVEKWQSKTGHFLRHCRGALLKIHCLARAPRGGQTAREVMGSISTKGAILFSVLFDMIAICQAK